MSRAGRNIRRVLLGVVALIVVVGLGLNFALGPVVRRAAEAAGPAVAGVPISIKDVSIQPWKGAARIEGLLVGAPEGFAANLAEMAHFTMKLRLSSLLGDTLVLEEIVIRGPVVTYELAGIHSNVGALLDRLKGDSETKEKTREKPSGARKVVVEHFLFEEGKVRLATTLTGGKGVVFPLPKIELHDIGKEKQGLAAVDAAGEMVGAVCVAVLTVVRDSVAGVAGLGADAVTAIAGAAGSGLQQAGALAGDAMQAVGGLAGEGVKAVGGLADEGAKAVGGALRAVGGLLGGSAAEKPAAEGAPAP